MLLPFISSTCFSNCPACYRGQGYKVGAAGPQCVSDTKGIKLAAFDLNGQAGKLRWETLNIIPGVYYYQLIDGASILSNGKIILMSP